MGHLPAARLGENCATSHDGGAPGPQAQPRTVGIRTTGRWPVARAVPRAPDVAPSSAKDPRPRGGKAQRPWVTADARHPHRGHGWRPRPRRHPHPGEKAPPCERHPPRGAGKAPSAEAAAPREGHAGAPRTGGEPPGGGGGGPPGRAVETGGGANRRLFRARGACRKIKCRPPQNRSRGLNRCRTPPRLPGRRPRHSPAAPPPTTEASRGTECADPTPPVPPGTVQAPYRPAGRSSSSCRRSAPSTCPPSTPTSSTTA